MDEPSQPQLDAVADLLAGLEDAAVADFGANHVATRQEVVITSIALSLKRIADAMCNEEEGNLLTSIWNLAYHAEVIADAMPEKDAR
jgi:hypothetical protein